MRRHSQGNQEPPATPDGLAATRPSPGSPRPKQPLSALEPAPARLEGANTVRIATGSVNAPDAPPARAVPPPLPAAAHARVREPISVSTATEDLPVDARVPEPAGPPRAPLLPPADGAHLEAMGSLLGELDAAFGAIVDPSVKGPSTHPPVWPSSSSISEIRELFSALAVTHMRQVRDFMIAVRWGEAHREWAAICEPAVRSLVRAAREMDMDALWQALTTYADALRAAASSSDPMLGGVAREDLMLAYQQVTQQMPEVFALEGERDRRETIIVHALLQQVPEVRKLAIDRMYAAGLTSLETLFLAKADDIAATTGIGEALASLIVAKFQEYRAEAAALVDPSRAAECERIGQLAAELRAVHQRFEALASTWGEDAHAGKRQARRERTELLLKVKVLLARLGEVDRIAALERLPFAGKIDRLEAFVLEARLHQTTSSSSKFTV